MVACILMAAAVPYTSDMAVSTTSPTYTHYVYMAGHAGWLHYLVNAWSLLILHNLFCWYRVLAAYIGAVAISYTLLPDQPMVGASVFTCFFIGFWAVFSWYKDKLSVLMSLGLLALTCILPGFAGIPHIAAYTLGLMFSVMERKIWHVISFLKF